MKIHSLRTKIILASLPVLTLGALGLYSAAYLCLIPEFQKIENISAIKDASRAVDALGNHLDQLNQKASDWSIWDDAYAFAKDHNKQFITANLQNNTLANLGVDYILFYNPNNQLTEMKHVQIDAPDLPSMPLDPGLKALLSPTSSLLNHANSNDVHQGLVQLPEGIIMLVSRPILTSQGTGPSRGSIVFGHFLDPAAQQQLASQTHLKLTYLDSSDSVVTNSVPAYPATASKGRKWVSLLTDTHARAFAVINDIYDKPSLAVQVDLERTVSQQGRKSMSTFIGISALILTLIVISTGVLLDKILLRRILGISSQLKNLKDIRDPSKMIRVNGHDELTSLAADTNDLLNRLYVTRDLRQANTTLEQEVSERTKELGDQLNQMKRMNTLMVGRELKMKELKEQNAKLRSRLDKELT